MKALREVLIEIGEIDEDLPIPLGPRLMFLLRGVYLGHGISSIQVTNIFNVVLYCLSLAVIYRRFTIILKPQPIFTDGFQVLLRRGAIHGRCVLPEVMLAYLGKSMGRLARIQPHRIVLIPFDHHGRPERDLREVFDVAIL